MNWNEKTKLGWAMPLTWPYLNSMTHISLMGVNRPDFVYLTSSRGGDLAEKRDYQVEKGLKLKCTEILLLDADMIYPPTVINDLYGLLKKGADMAGGLCFRGYPPYNPLIWHPTEERQLIPFKEYNFGDVVTAGATGAACLLVKSEVFRGLKRPWFRLMKEKKTENGVTTEIKRGEDTYFTRNATKAGFKLKVLTKYDIGHLREFSIDRHFWITFAILNQMGSWENAIILLKKMGNKKWLKRILAQPKSKGGGRNVRSING